MLPAIGRTGSGSFFLERRDHMFKKILRTVKGLADMYSAANIPRASAALCYYLTMTIFPLIICLYTLLGKSYGRAMEALELVESFLAEETVQFIQGFLDYVAAENSSAMLVAGLTVLVSSASASVRTLQASIGEMQGGRRFQGLMGFVFSVILALIFIGAMYFAILVIFTGREFVDFLSLHLPFLNISGSWQWFRFLLLAGIEIVIFWGVYETAKRRSDKYETFPGAVFAAIATVLMSFAFSVFIGVSARYPLVYGSLASLILLMLWLYLSCQIIYTGAAINICLRNEKRRGQEYRTNMKQ